MAGARRPPGARTIRFATPRILAIVGILIGLLVCAIPAGAEPGPPLGAPTPTGGASPSTTDSTGPAGGAGGAVAPVRVDLVSVTPMSPDATNLTQPVTITAIAVNTSGTTYTGVRANLERGAAIVQPSLLNDAVAAPPPTEQWPPRPQPQAQPAPLLPGGTATITFVTNPEQMCLCYTGVFPYDLVIEGDAGSGYTEVGRTATVIPSFQTQPTHRTTVSWVWPLIDQPHRIGTSSVFLDDDLARSVSPGGRLDRSLQVVEQVGASVRMTLVIDPRLLDELITMTGGYTVHSSAGDAPGAGAGAASAWLVRLRTVAPATDVILTPYGDPDPATVVAVGGELTWAMPQGVDQRIRQLLGVPFRTDVAWPDSTTLSSDGLSAVVAAGATTVLTSANLLAEKPTLPGTAISPGTVDGSAISAIALDPSLQSRVDDAVSTSALREPGAPAAATSTGTQTAATRIQALLAQLSLWPINGLDGYVALTPPQRVDPDPTAASAAILATATQSWSRSEGLEAALDDRPRLSRGAVEPAPRSAPSAGLVAAIATANRSAAAAVSLVGEAASPVLLSTADAIVEASASAWRSDPDRGVQFANIAEAQAGAITNAVGIATPDNASYSLPSENSPLILTLRNDLPYDVQVRVTVAPAPGSTAGFSADDVGVVVLPANGTRTLHVPAHFERSGRFQIQAQLATVDGITLGDPVRINVLCTAIGGVALAVTGVAFGLLVCLLVFRAVRGLRRRRAATLGSVASPDGSTHDSEDRSAGEGISPAIPGSASGDDGPATS